MDSICMTRDDVRKNIRGILQDFFDLDLSSADDDFENINLFTKEIGLTSKDYVYFYHLLEKEFNIRFTDDDVDNEKFYFINGLTDIVFDELP